MLIQGLCKCSGNVGEKDHFRYSWSDAGFGKEVELEWLLKDIQNFSWQICWVRSSKSGEHHMRGTGEMGKWEGRLKSSSITSYKFKSKLKASCSKFTGSQPGPSLNIVGVWFVATIRLMYIYTHLKQVEIDHHVSSNTF